ncbi:MAG TPA: type II toxin-antitoxin system RelE/ParE family toxin [Acidobacteriaceae bacterium]
MSTWKLTRKARTDYAEILLYTIDAWGEEQAERYLALLLDGFDLLAQNPGIGRPCNRLAPRLRRFEQGKHVIFYKPDRNGIIVSRVLHQSRLPARPHFIDA